MFICTLIYILTFWAAEPTEPPKCPSCQSPFFSILEDMDINQILAMDGPLASAQEEVTVPSERYA